jgi:hypothetical protein
MDPDHGRAVEEGVRNGWHLGELAVAAGAAVASFFGGRKAGRASVVGDLLDTFRAESEATRETIRAEGIATRGAIADAIGHLHRRVDHVSETVARVEGKIG